jgi:hypothetical protein
MSRIKSGGLRGVVRVAGLGRHYNEPVRSRQGGYPRSPWDDWYQHRLWKARRRQQLHDHPLCLYCERAGLIVQATIVNHNPPHQGDLWSGREPVPTMP